jgi:hypothetical protein
MAIDPVTQFVTGTVRRFHFPSLNARFRVDVTGSNFPFSAQWHPPCYEVLSISLLCKQIDYPLAPSKFYGFYGFHYGSRT